MRYSAVDTATELPCAAPPAGKPTLEGVKYMYFPRIRCHDCPGKLYTIGPETTVGNFEVHLKNQRHRERVDGRVAGGSTAASGSGGAYLDQLIEFHNQHGTNLNRFPTVDKRPLDLYKLRGTVETMGGFEKVCEMKKWPQVGRILGYEGKIMSSLSTSLKNTYLRYVLPYEEHLQLGKEDVPPERHSKKHLTTSQTPSDSLGSSSEASQSPEPQMRSSSVRESDNDLLGQAAQPLVEPTSSPRAEISRRSLRSTPKSLNPESDFKELKY
jgi:hypothetical protein